MSVPLLTESSTLVHNSCHTVLAVALDQEWRQSTRSFPATDLFVKAKRQNDSTLRLVARIKQQLNRLHACDELILAIT